LVQVDRFYPSSKTCSECSVKNEELTLNDRVWTCASCETELDRDQNAAQNLRAEGIYQLTEMRYIFDNRREDVRLGARSFLALLQSMQQSSMKRAGSASMPGSEMAQISN
ncbi:MAG: transposase, partial [Gammaproteobacteria bacterium]|nr:transposase [Gammaproteobacteria bacterium]